MKRKFSKRLTTLITVFALLLLIIPAGALFADTLTGGDLLPASTTEESEGTIDVESSEQAAVVAERITAASTLGIAPGRLNLIDKLAAIMEVPEGEREAFRLLWSTESAQNIMKEVSRYRFADKEKELPPGLQTEAAETAGEPKESGNNSSAAKKGHAYGKNK